MTRLFGTDGIRGRAGEPPLDEATVRRLGRALGRVLARDLHHEARVVVGRDTRESGPALLRALASGLAASGAVVRSAGVVPTPAVSLLARGDEFDAGVMISASHNPWQDNGLKVFSHSGTKLRDELEREVERALDELPDEPAEAGDGPPDEPALAGRHASWLEGLAAEAGLRLDGCELVVDCANGSASPFAAALLEGLGARVRALADRPDGRNINRDCGSLHLEALAAQVRERGAELGIAFDGDADRALFVDGEGRTVDGDQVLALTAARLQRLGRLEGGRVVGTIMSNFGLERALHGLGLALERAAVGDRFVLERMLESGASLGGEPSGHVIFLEDAPTGDGLLTALHVLAAVTESGRSLAELASGFPRTPQLLVNVAVSRRVPLEDLDGWPDLDERWRRLFGEDGRFVVRYSGTEPLVRVMAEGTNPELVQDCVDELAGHLQRALGAPEA